MSEISQSSKVSISASHLSCELDDEAVILDTKKKTYYGLEPVGAKIWQLIKDPITVGEIVDSLVAEFEVEEDTCLADCLSFLSELQEKELIEVEST